MLFELQNNILLRLSEDERLMERWDPTDIINQVFPFHQLQLYVFKVTLGILTVSLLLHMYFTFSDGGSSTNARTSRLITMTCGYFYMLGILFVCVLLNCILCGASPFHHVQHLLMACWYLTLLSFGYYEPPGKNTFGLRSIIVHVMLGGGEYEQEDVKLEGGPSHEISMDKPSDIREYIHRCVMYTTLVVTIPFQVLHILDHGDQIQRFPIPIILGSTIGHCAGCIFGVVLGSLHWCSVMNQKKSN